jgi:regulator of protease activity HflC (stomatin/prohibitin superfamily)
MRSELGKMTFDKTFEERATLNEKITVCLVFHHEFFV